MWSELLPKLVGGTLTDHDAPDEPTVIVGYELSDEWIEITGKEFSFGSDRRYIGVTHRDGQLELCTTYGMSATIKLPEQPR